MVDFKKLREKLKESEKRKNGSSAESSVFMRVEIGSEKTIRFPTSEDGDYFQEYYMHYGLEGQKAVVCNKKTYGEKCPICEKLWDMTGNMEKTKPVKNFLSTVMPKLRIYSSVLVRGEEIEGAKIWSYSPKLRDTLFTEIAKEEINFDNFEQGYDITIENKKTDKRAGGKEIGEIVAFIARKPSPMLPTDLNEEEFEAIIKSIDNLDVKSYLEFLTEDKEKQYVDALVSMYEEKVLGYSSDGNSSSGDDDSGNSAGVGRIMDNLKDDDEEDDEEEEASEEKKKPSHQSIMERMKKKAKSTQN